MTALFFPGQGSQYVGMTKDFYDEFAVARETFEKIENSVKINLRDIIFTNKSELLNITKYSQLAIYSSSMCIFNVLQNEIDIDKLFIKYSLGHSLGEYSALTVSNVISIEEKPDNPKSKIRRTAAVRYRGNGRRGIGRPKDALRRAGATLPNCRWQ